MRPLNAALGFALEMWFSRIAPRTSATREKLEAAIKDQNKDRHLCCDRKEQRRADAHRTNSETAGSRFIESTTRSLLTRSETFQTAETTGARIALLYGDEWPQVK